MATIARRDLLLRTEVGFNPHEIGKKQDIVLNIRIDYTLQGEELSDNPEEALEYRSICKEVIGHIESRKYNLIEKVASDVAELVLALDRVEAVTVEVIKPNALRFSKSVSFCTTKTRKG
jgi:D-erythro-7,8-dihydroneopterin triphosphate epimerase